LTPQNGTGTPENNKKQALRAFGVKKYRVAIDFFLLPFLNPVLTGPLNGKRKVSFLCVSSESPLARDKRAVDINSHICIARPGPSA